MINFNNIFPFVTSSSKLSSSFKFHNQNAIYISLFLICDTRFPPLIILHLINTNNIWWGARIMKIIIKQIFPSSCHFLRVRSKYLPNHPIQHLLLHQLGRPSCPTVWTKRRNYISFTKGHPSYMLFDGKKNMMYNQTVQIVIQYSVFILHFIHKRSDTFLRPSQHFLYIYNRCITFFMTASQVPSYSTLHQTPANTLHLFLKIGLYIYVKNI